MSPIILNSRELLRLKIYSHHLISPLPKAPFRNFSLVNKIDHKGLEEYISVAGSRDKETERVFYVDWRIKDDLSWLKKKYPKEYSELIAKFMRIGIDLRKIALREHPYAQSWN